MSIPVDDKLQMSIMASVIYAQHRQRTPRLYPHKPFTWHAEQFVALEARSTNAITYFVVATQEQSER